MSKPAGSGSEIMKVELNNDVSTSEVILIDGVADHIYSLLSVIVCETAGTARTFNLYIDNDGGGTDTELLSDQAIGANETFVFNEKLVLSDTDHLCITATGAVDVTTCFIDQNWE